VFQDNNNGGASDGLNVLALALSILITTISLMLIFDRDGVVRIIEAF
jgi:hypothetical protein